MGASFVCQLGAIWPGFWPIQALSHPPPTPALHLPAAMMPGSRQMRARRCRTGCLTAQSDGHGTLELLPVPTVLPLVEEAINKCASLGGCHGVEPKCQACAPDQTGAGNNHEAFTPCFRILVSAYPPPMGIIEYPFQPTIQWPQLSNPLSNHSGGGAASSLPLNLRWVPLPSTDPVPIY